jgi:hypothetical protein
MSVKAPVTKLIAPIGLAFTIAALMCGCSPAEPGNYQRIAPNTAQGPAGGEAADMTSPVGINAVLGGDQTAVVFPDTAKPG